MLVEEPAPAGMGHPNAIFALWEPKQELFSSRPSIAIIIIIRVGATPVNDNTCRNIPKLLLYKILNDRRRVPPDLWRATDSRGGLKHRDRQ